MMTAGTVARIINAIIDAINRKKKSDASNNPADTIANGGRVLDSDETYANMASKSRSDSSE